MDTRLRFITPPGPCGYLPDRTWQLEYEIAPELTTGEFMARLREGWRRFGHAMFRPVCPSCRMCQSLRVCVADFSPDRSQRRAWKANAGEVTITVGRPVPSTAKRALYEKFHAQQTQIKGWPLPDAQQLDVFFRNPFPTEEWCYRLGGRLVGVGYVDRLPQGLSAIYFFHDPAERDRSLGTFNVLSVIAAARQASLPHVYLGYYVEGYQSLAYKSRFRPNEVLQPDGSWRPLVVPPAGAERGGP
jgi:arginine-tRNA-protein transferase